VVIRAATAQGAGICKAGLAIGDAAGDFAHLRVAVTPTDRQLDYSDLNGYPLHDGGHLGIRKR